MDALGSAAGGAGGDEEGREARGEVRGARPRRRRTRATAFRRLSKLAELVDGEYRIVSQPPIVVPARDVGPQMGMSADEIEERIHEQLRAYRETLQDDRRQLLERFELVDVARKVVGVGSVGTRAYIGLLQGRDQDDPLFLQVKEATASVLEDHLPKSRYRAARRTRRAGTADDAGRERHLPGLDQGRRGQPLPVLAPAARHEGLGRRRGDAAATASRSTAASAGRRSHVRTRARAIRSRSLRTSARRTASRSRSPTSPSGTPTRTSATTTRSSRRSSRAGSRRSKASDEHPAATRRREEAAKRAREGRSGRTRRHSGPPLLRRRVRGAVARARYAWRGCSARVGACC